MTNAPWTWKGKDGSRGRLLYEPGNWGDLLKLLWLETFLAWRAERRDAGVVDYLDPFAGAPDYPLGERTRFRFDQAELAGLERLRDPFIRRNRWPSSAMAARTMGAGGVTVFDADPERFARWDGIAGVARAAAASGWELLEKTAPGPGALWLVDPYDFIAEWRVRLPLLREAAGKATLFVYIYNRAAKGPEAFAEYRAFRNALDDTPEFAAKRLGRIASDAFLPRAHHELLFLPSGKVAEDGFFSRLLERFEEAVVALSEAQRRAGAFEC